MFDYFKDLFGDMDIEQEDRMVRIMLYEIRDRNPASINFVINVQAVRTVLLHLKMKKYVALMYLYGKEFLGEILKMYEECEKYEECQVIIDQVEEHNRLMNDNVKIK